MIERAAVALLAAKKKEPDLESHGNYGLAPALYVGLCLRESLVQTAVEPL